MTPLKLKKTLEGFAGLRGVILGDSMLDVYLFGEVSRISPEAPVPVVRLSRREERPGGAANVALNLRTLGVQVELASVVGDDENGRRLRGLMADQKIGTDAVFEVKDRLTTVKTRVVSQQQQILRLDEESVAEISGRLRADLLQRVEGLLEKADFVVVSDYDKGVISDGGLRHVVQLCRKKGRKLYVDPKPAHVRGVRGAHMIAPNESEMWQVSHLVGPLHNDFDRALRFLQKTLGVDLLVVTRGEKGMSYCDGQKVENIPAFGSQVYDVTGAGDTVLSILACSLTRGVPVRDACWLANLAASIVVTRLGAAAVTAEDLLQRAKTLK